MGNLSKGRPSFVPRKSTPNSRQRYIIQHKTLVIFELRLTMWKLARCADFFGLFKPAGTKKGSTQFSSWGPFLSCPFWHKNETCQPFQTFSPLLDFFQMRLLLAIWNISEPGGSRKVSLIFKSLIFTWMDIVSPAVSDFLVDFCIRLRPNNMRKELGSIIPQNPPGRFSA